MDAAERLSFNIFSKECERVEADRIEWNAIKFYDDGLKGRAYKEFQKLIEQAQKLDPGKRQGYIDRAHRYMALCEEAIERTNRNIPSTRKQYAQRKI